MIGLNGVVKPYPTDVTLRMKWRYLTQAIQGVYNDFKRELNQDSRQVTIYYHKFRQYQIKPGQLDRTLPCKRRKKKRESSDWHIG